MDGSRPSTAPSEASETNEPIRVLLVDDNEQWARFIAEEIEQAKQRLHVDVAMSANEAILTLQNDGSFDCVVTDYRMPAIDGIQLLERIRDDRPNLPCILVTGQGNEDVASRASEAGVTDYVQKGPRMNQGALFATRIERAVEELRLRRAVEQSEKRYRTITEQVRDAVAIFQHNRVVFCNEPLADFTGLEREELGGVDFLEELVHPDDREWVREVVSGLPVDTDIGLHEARLLTSGGEVRHCEYTGRSISHEGEPATLVSIRDVTDRELRERALERERELSYVVQEHLVASRTREEIEAGIVRELYEHGYDLVWIGEATETSVEPRVLEGDTGYVDDLRLSLDADGHDREPCLWTAQTGEPQFVTDFEDMFPTEWRELALERGFRTGAALPLVYENISYGFLAVYHESPARMDEAEKHLLSELADTVAYAIHHVESRQALTADRGVDVELVLEGPGYYLVETLSELEFDVSDVEITVHETHSNGEGGVVQYVTPAGGLSGDVSLEAFREVVGRQAVVEDVTVLTSGESPRFRVTLTGQTPESRLASFGAMVRVTRVTANRTTIRCELATRKNLSEAVETLEDRYGPVSVSVSSCVGSDRTADVGRAVASVDLTNLTEKQASALKAALHQGYFEQPRESSASEVADSLNITHSTFLQHLRAAQRKVFVDLFGS